jgi:hypothetical protein
VQSVKQVSAKCIANRLFLLSVDHPMAEGPDDKNRGQFYCGTRFFAKQLQFSGAKTGTSYDNMGNVMTSLGHKLSNWVIHRKKK